MPSNKRRILAIILLCLCATAPFAAAETLRYPCPICAKPFDDHPSLLRHIRGDHPPIRCTACKGRFATAAALARHKRRVHFRGAKTLRCKLCKQSFGTGPDLATHMARTHPSRRKRSTWPCRLCNRRYASLKALVKHRKRRHAKVFRSRSVCPFCKKVQTSAEALRLHLRKTHRLVVPTKKVKCRHCALRLLEGPSLAEHMRSAHPMQARNRVRCPFCHTFFPNGDRLDVHIRTAHTDLPGVRCIRCPYCSEWVPKGPPVEEHMISAHPEKLKGPRRSAPRSSSHPKSKR